MEGGAIILEVLLALIGIFMIYLSASKQFKANGTAKFFTMIFGILLVGYALVGFGAQVGLYELGGASSFFLSTTVEQPADNVNNNYNQNDGGLNYQPTASYSARDKYSTTAVSGTAYYKVNSNSATTTAYTNTNKGDTIKYWVSNSSWWIEPITKDAQAGVTVFEALGFENSSASLSLYDLINRQSVAAATYNVTLGANDNANIEVTYQGTSEGSAGPFGGVMVVEYASTISRVTCTGDDLMTGENPYHVTYAVGSTNHTSIQFPYKESLDDGTGAVNRIECQFKNGATATTTGDTFTFTFIPANYYVTNSGDIVLDTEKNANGDTTRTGSLINSPSVSGMWA